MNKLMMSTNSMSINIQKFVLKSARPHRDRFDESFGFSGRVKNHTQRLSNIECVSTKSKLERRLIQPRCRKLFITLQTNHFLELPVITANSEGLSFYLYEKRQLYLGNWSFGKNHHPIC